MARRKTRPPVVWGNSGKKEWLVVLTIIDWRHGRKVRERVVQGMSRYGANVKRRRRRATAIAKQSRRRNRAC